jgi:hypothetical protein
MLAVASLSPAHGRAEDAADARPKGTTVVGTVCSRLGSCVVVAAAEGVKLRLGEQFLVGRPSLLVAVAKGKQRLDAWGNWQEAGRIAIRLLRAERYAIAFVASETPRTGLGQEPVPNIRPGDLVYRPAAAGAPSPKP